MVLHEDGTWEYSGKIGFFDIEKSGITRINEVSIADLLPCTIIEVIDGDTIKVVFVDPPPGIQQEESIRLLGIDAPVLQTSINPDPLATEAREFVIAHTADPTVSRLRKRRPISCATYIEQQQRSCLRMASSPMH